MKLLVRAKPIKHKDAPDTYRVFVTRENSDTEVFGQDVPTLADVLPEMAVMVASLKHIVNDLSKTLEQFS